MASKTHTRPHGEGYEQMLNMRNCSVCRVSSSDCRRIGKAIVCIACANTYNEVRTLVLEAGRDPATYQ